MFTKYGAASPELVELTDNIEKLFVDFTKRHAINDSVELRAVANFACSGIQVHVCESVLRKAMDMRKKERANTTS